MCSTRLLCKVFERNRGAGYNESLVQGDCYVVGQFHTCTQHNNGFDDLTVQCLIVPHIFSNVNLSIAQIVLCFT